MKLQHTSPGVDGVPVTLTRIEDDPAAIANLKRKGWVEVPADPPAPVVPVVPSEVPLWAFRSVLEIAGLTFQVNNILAAIPGEEGIVARNQWEFANYAVRNDPVVIGLAQQLGLTPEQADAYFIQAAGLTQ